MKEISKRILVQNIINDTSYSECLDADKIMYNSIYFRYYQRPIKNFPEEVGNTELILYTINFKLDTNENSKPSLELKIGYGCQFCISMINQGLIFFRIFHYGQQKYLSWRKINIV